MGVDLGSIIAVHHEEQPGQPKHPGEPPNSIGPSGAGGGGPGGSGYNSDLFQITKNTHTMEGHLEHPQLKGLTAHGAHAGPDIHLMPREYAAEQNAAQFPDSIETYHSDRPVIGYRTDMPTDGLARAWGPSDQPAAPKEAGPWAGQAEDYRASDGSVLTGREVSEKFSLPSPSSPTHLSTVSPDIGTIVEASTTRSGAVRQYKMDTWKSEWFHSKKTLG